MNLVPSSSTPFHMTKPSDSLRPSLVVFKNQEGSVIDFQETRFLVSAHKLNKELWPVVVSIASQVGTSPMTKEQLASLPLAVLNSGVHSALDIMDLQHVGPNRRNWIPFALFSDGERLLSLHATYGPVGASLVGVTLRSKGTDQYTDCRSSASATKVCRSFLSSVGYNHE